MPHLTNHRWKSVLQHEDNAICAFGPLINLSVIIAVCKTEHEADIQPTRHIHFLRQPCSTALIRSGLRQHDIRRSVCGIADKFH